MSVDTWRKVEVVGTFFFAFSFLWLGIQVVEIHNHRESAWEECRFPEADKKGIYNFTQSQNNPLNTSSVSSETSRVSNPENNVSSSIFSSVV